MINSHSRNMGNCSPHGQDPARKDYALKAVAVPGARAISHQRVRFGTVQGLAFRLRLGLRGPFGDKVSEKASMSM